MYRHLKAADSATFGRRRGGHYLLGFIAQTADMAVHIDFADLAGSMATTKTFLEGSRGPMI
jgi:hypothetical protein